MLAPNIPPSLSLPHCLAYLSQVFFVTAGQQWQLCNAGAAEYRQIVFEQAPMAPMATYGRF
jgi:hypothetical protein